MKNAAESCYCWLRGDRPRARGRAARAGYVAGVAVTTLTFIIMSMLLVICLNCTAFGLYCELLKQGVQNCAIEKPTFNHLERYCTSLFDRYVWIIIFAVISYVVTYLYSIYFNPITNGIRRCHCRFLSFYCI